MGIADRLRFRKQSAGPLPTQIGASLAEQGMNFSSDFGPGSPLQPSHGYSTGARRFDYPAGANISIRPRTGYGRPSFDTLRAMINAWDLARICINHKIDELRGMELLFSPMDGYDDDPGMAIKAARAALDSPDRELPFDAWLSKWGEGLWRYDAACLYRRRELSGEVIALEVVDGTSILPYIDEYGRRPLAPAPAFAQIIKGIGFEWLTTDDLIYTPFRPQLDSPYGLAPIESIILTANTDLRFQKYFLDYFTDGSLPTGFLNAPGDASTPDQVAEWQDFWDALMIGDQEALRQIKVIPADMKFDQVRDATFDSDFPIYLMRRCCAAFGVVPQDLGITLDVNRSNGETQVDVQFRVNTRPSMMFMQGVLSRYLQNDLGLPIQVAFDDGQEKEDRLAEAQTWGVYIDKGIASPDEARQELLGLPVDSLRPFPRFYATSRGGPVPENAILAVAGPIDPDTAAPTTDAVLPSQQFLSVEGTLTTPPPLQPGLAVEERGPSAVPPPAPAEDLIQPPAPVAKGEPTAGITSATGLQGYDLVGAVATPSDDEDEDDEADEDEAASVEKAAFRRFVKARRKAGRWRDFEFAAVPARRARTLNRDGRALLRKDVGELVAAGLCVQADDTGRVLMLQRALDPDDPAGGTWEIPGGHIEPGEHPLDAAVREWQEEVGVLLPATAIAAGGFASWVSANGVYAGYVLTVASEAMLSVADRVQVTNPDDPDGDIVEAVAWFDPALLDGMPGLRPELAASLPAVLPLLASTVEPAEILDDAALVKAGDGHPKASWRDSAAKVPQHRYDVRLVDHYAPKIADALNAAVPDSLIASVITTGLGLVTKDATPDPAQDALRHAIETALAGAAINLSELDSILRDVILESFAAGGHAAGEQVGSGATTLSGISDIDWDAWAPGDPDAAALVEDGGLEDLLADAGVRIQGVSDTLLTNLGNAIADGLRAGNAVATVTQDVRDLIGSTSRSERIAQTEVSRAMTSATMATYTANNIGQWDLIPAGGACPECEAIEAANPHSVSDSGDQPPVHPFCRCAASPVVPT